MHNWTVSPTPPTSDFPLNLNASYPMAFFNDFYNPRFYSASPASRKSDAYPFYAGVLANAEVNPRQPTGNWGIGGGSGHMVGPPNSLRAGTSSGGDNHSLSLGQGHTICFPGPMNSVSTYTRYGQPLGSEYRWPVTGQAQPHSSGPVSWDNSCPRMTTFGIPVVTPAPSSGESFSSYEVLRNQVLTDRKQPHSTTGGTTTMLRPPAGSTWQVLGLGHPYVTPPIPPRRTRNPRIDPGLMQRGPG